MQEFTPVPTRSKPVRIFESDDAALSVVAGLLRRSRAEVVHAALVEYLAKHRDELGSIFKETQRAIAEGDLEALATASAAGLEAEIDALIADLPS